MHELWAWAYCLALWMSAEYLNDVFEADIRSHCLGYYRLISWSWRWLGCRDDSLVITGARGRSWLVSRLFITILLPCAALEHWSPSTRHPVVTMWRIDMTNNLPGVANDTHLSPVLSLHLMTRALLTLWWPECRAHCDVSQSLEKWFIAAVL